MKTAWKWSTETEAQRIVHLAHQMGRGFYQENGFIVLPSGRPTQNPSVVVFPDIGLQTIPGFWKRVRKANISHWPVSRDEKLIRQIGERLEAQDGWKEPDLPDVRPLWDKYSNKIIRQCEIVTGLAMRQHDLMVYPSYYGTPVSFNAIHDGTQTIQLFFRLDQDLFTLVEGILSALLKNELVLSYNASWRERELIVDYIIHSSVVGSLLRQYSPESEAAPTSELIQKREYTALKRRSVEFLSRLKIPGRHKSNIRSKVFSLYLGAQKLTNLTWKERRVLMLLGENRDSLVDTDRIASVIFPDEEEYSLYALAKFISRLREKLEENGIPGNLIETVRKRGYALR